jgi:hypothetical protein
MYIAQHPTVGQRKPVFGLLGGHESLFLAFWGVTKAWFGVCQTYVKWKFEL